MLYTNFDNHIMDKFGIVCEGWPLEQFCAPADLYTRMEVEILHRSWSTDTTTFRHLSPDELVAWREQRLQAQLSPAQESSVPPSHSVPPSQTITTTAAATTATATTTTAAAAAAESPVSSDITSHPLSFSVMSVSGDVLLVKKPRKTRSDKNKLRGRRQRAAVSGAPTVAA